MGRFLANWRRWGGWEQGACRAAISDRVRLPRRIIKLNETLTLAVRP
jgi:hypothetical protein